LENIVRGSVATKARLLHYFPTAEGEKEEEKSDDSWCGTHTDLGALTGLTSNMFVDEAIYEPRLQSSTDGVLEELDAHPDPKAGLWIKDRAGRTTQVDIPRDCLAFQTGEALQLITKGKFRAVPHFVRGAKGGKIARNTLAVFTQPNLWEVVDGERGLDFAGLAKEIFGRTY
jgi:isopenicillin N synthase-like dioxygenase